VSGNDISTCASCLGNQFSTCCLRVSTDCCRCARSGSTAGTAAFQAASTAGSSCSHHLSPPRAAHTAAGMAQALRAPAAQLSPPVAPAQRHPPFPRSLGLQTPDRQGQTTGALYVQSIKIKAARHIHCPPTSESVCPHSEQAGSASALKPSELQVEVSCI